jgi:hypothetical protein
MVMIFGLSIAFIGSDFYFQGIGRPFDYLVLALTTLYLVRNYRSYSARVAISSFALIFLMLPWLLIGALQGHLLIASAMSAGALLVFPGVKLYVMQNPQSVDSGLKITTKIILLFFFIQFFVYYISKTYIDFHSMVGSISSRGLNIGLSLFRPSGIYQEPNSYCVALYCLLAARVIVFRAKDWTVIVGLVSMMISQSLWGVVGAIILSYLIYGAKRWGYTLLGILTLSSIVLNLLDFSFSDLVDASFTLNRIATIDEDASRDGRLGSIENYLGYEHLMFGNGVSSDQFQQLGANGFAFVLYSSGIVGSLLILSASFPRSRLHAKKSIIVLFLFSTFPPVAYMFFWAWLAIMFSKIPYGVMKEEKPDL